MTSAARPASFLQDGLRLVSNQLLVTVLGLLSGVILARCIGVEGRGLLAAVAVYPVLFLHFAQMGVRQSAAFYLGRQIYTDPQIVGAVSTVGLLIATVGVIACAGAMVATGNPAFTPGIIALAVASLPLTLVEYLCSGVFLGKKLVGQLVRVQRMAVLQRLVLIVLLVWWLALDVPGALAASLLSGSLVAWVALRRVACIAPLRPRFDLHTIRALLSKGVVYSVVLFVGVLVEQIDIVLLERLSAFEEIGLYTTAFSVCAFASLVPSALLPALFSYSANASNDSVFVSKVAVLLRITLIFSIASMVLLTLLAPFLIPFVYGADFALAADIMVFLAPATVSSIYAKLLIADLAGRGRPYVTLWATLPGLLVILVSDLILIPRFGAFGAAASSSIGQVLVAVVLTLLYAHYSGIPPMSLLRYRTTDFNFLNRMRSAVVRSASKLAQVYRRAAGGT